MRTVNYNRRGIALLWMAILSFVLVGFLALATDTLWAVLVNHQLQNAADAASLAGARHVRQDQSQARLEAQTFAGLNVGGTNSSGDPAMVQLDLNTSNDAAGNIVLGRYIATANPQFTPNTTNPNAVRVRAPRIEGSLAGSQPLLFGYHFNGAEITHANIMRTATAVTAGGLGAGLLVLDPTGPNALTLQGGPDLAVIDGTIQVNSSSSTAVLVSGNYTVTGEELNIVGAMSNPPTTIPVNMGMPVIPDPLSWLQSPQNINSMTNHGDVFNQNSTLEFSPGLFPYGIKQTGGKITFQPGTYVIGTAGLPNSQTRGFEVTGGEIEAVGCTFYIRAGGVKWTGGIFDISAPPLEQGHYYEHITVFQARDNASNSEINGNNDFNIVGTLYFPGALDGSSGPTLDLKGTFGGANQGTGEGVQIITYRMILGGTANLVLNFDGWWPGPLYSRVFLVE